MISIITPVIILISQPCPESLDVVCVVLPEGFLSSEDESVLPVDSSSSNNITNTNK